ncbi:hypothetical protein ACWDCZ_03635, partial [Kitasatospora sp. NPDC001225]
SCLRVTSNSPTGFCPGAGQNPKIDHNITQALERWGAGLTTDRVERRMAVRLSQERLLLVGEDDAPQNERDQIAQLPSVRRLTALGSSPGDDVERGGRPDLQGPSVVDGDLAGDDDGDEECEATFPGEEADGVCPMDEDDFYSDIWETS